TWSLKSEVWRLTAQRRGQDSFRHLSGIEIGFRDLARGAAMPAIVGVDGLKTVDRLLKRIETKHSSSVGEERAWPGVLHHHGFAAGEVADGAIADPAGLQFDVGRLRTTELAARMLDIGLIHLRRRRDFARVPDGP